MFGGRKPLGKQRGRWEDAVWRYAVNLLQVQDRKAARKREVERMEIREAMAPKRPEAPENKKKNKMMMMMMMNHKFNFSLLMIVEIQDSLLL